MTSGKINSLKGKKEHRAYIILGSNLGDRAENLLNARSQIELRCGEILHTSSLYESEPWEMNTEQWFINQVIELRTDKNPDALLKIALQIEQDLGRVRMNTGQYESRLIDIDILYYDDIVYQKDDLQIPHPRIQDRRFVLVPVAELNQGLIHPILGKSQKELLNICQDTTQVKWMKKK